MGNKKSKIAIIGAGNAGCISALYLLDLKLKNHCDKIGEIEIHYDPNIPMERVGQGNTQHISELLFRLLDVNWFDKNLIKATVKTGIRYKNWGKKNHDFLHPFDNGQVACHYIPQLISKTTLNCGNFKVKEGNVKSTSEIDADFIIDCRGKHLNQDEKYITIKNPLNSALLTQKEGKRCDLLFTECVATPHGWTFVIPNHDSVSYGYLYNKNITSKKEAEFDFKEKFDAIPNFCLDFKNYVAKNVWDDERTLLNGNRYSFIEPLEATSTTSYATVVEFFCDYLNGEITKKQVNKKIMIELGETAHFLLQHYTSGSKYDTKFWEYAKRLSNSVKHKRYEKLMNLAKKWNHLSTFNTTFGIWDLSSLNNWYDNVLND